MILGYSPWAGVFRLHGGAITRMLMSPPPFLRHLYASACVWIVPGTHEDEL